MKILVTGGAGFIGSHVVDGYLAAGHEVVVVDDLSTGKAENLDSRVKFYQLDIRSPELEKVFLTERPEVVNHHAAQVSVPRSIEEPIADAQVNILGFINVMQCCVKCNIKKIIYISSGGAIYGDATEYPTPESYIPMPLSVYALNKMAGEQYLLFYAHQYGLKYTVLRYANVYGPRQIPQGEAGVVSLFIDELIHDRQPTINSYPDEPDGMIRDYVYVHDVVRANMAALNSGDNDCFNIGTCVETTTLLLYKTISWHLGKAIVPKVGPPRKGDLKRSMLESSKAFKELGWSHIYTLDQGIKETVEYFVNKEVNK